MKKLLSVIFTFILTLSMCSPVWAATMSSDGETTQVPVRYTVKNTAFTINVPALITPTSTAMKFTISSSKMNLRPDEHIEVKVSSGCDSNGVVTLTRTNVPEGKKAAEIRTTMTIGGKSISENDFLVGYFEDSAQSTTNTLGSVTLTPISLTEATEAGDYEGTVCFTVSLVK